MDSLLSILEQYQVPIVIVAGAIVLLVLGWLAIRAMRNRTRDRTVERPTGTIRRPVYTDMGLLEELRAHGEPRGTGATTTTSATAGSSGGTSGADEIRRVNDTLDALEGTSVLIDLDADPDAALEPGKAVVLTGRLERHPASTAVEILELSAPLLHRGASNGQDDGGTATLPQARTQEATADTTPIVVRLDHPSAKRGYLMVLPREHLRVEDPTRDTVSVLAVVDRVVDRRETVAAEDYLGAHLSAEGRSMFGDRDLAETVAALSDVANEDLGADDLPFKGPGAILTPAALHR